MVSLPSLVNSTVAIPDYDGSSWLSSLGDALKQSKDKASLKKSADGFIAVEIDKQPAPAPQQEGTFLGRLKDRLSGTAQPSAAILGGPVFGRPQQGQRPGNFLSQFVPQQVQQPMGIGPVGKVERAALPSGDIYKNFIGTVQAGGVQNPYALAAIASTGSRESGFSADKANATWSDPSQAGAAGTAGGILSWRNERLQNLYRYAASKGEQPGGISPQTQAEYFLREDPALIQKLNTAGSVEEAQNLMNNAWRYAGYDRQGGETAARMARANAYLPEFANRPAQGQPQTAADAIEAIAPLNGAPKPQFAPQAYAEQPTASSTPGAISQQNFDDRFGPVPLPSETHAQGVDGLRAGLAQQPAPTPAGITSAAPATYAPAPPAPMQQNPQAHMAGASGQVNMPDYQQIPQGRVSKETLRYMLSDPNLREMGMKLWQQNVTGSSGSQWSFVQGKDGTLFRANQKTGSVEPIGNFAKGAGEEEWGLNLVYGKDPATGKTVVGQASKSGKFKPVDVPEGFQVTPGTSSIDTGTHIITRDSKTGQTINTVTKENRQEAADKASGTVEGRTAAERAASASGDFQAAQNNLDLIEDIKKDPYRQFGTGMTSIMNRVPGTGGYDFNQKVEQAKSGAFLTAIQQMRGLGALSNSEGQAATAAVTRMDTSMSEEGFLAALDDYEKIVRQAMDRAKANLPSQEATEGSARGPRPNGAAGFDFSNMSDEQLRQLAGEQQ
ncbi:hypothetical protein IFT84_13095 [Rhizobium sp. CFBP 8762]|uniref:hypothetical protein n=1 Tax=Rhizobium sp. CFBP 8762 TaxID=2775279 RepID=UPI00177A8546|nr:hypothetical protein [Rhizobium sp. CFBP 8762]MBD8555441.1 hypothetical protein [Rhizobium sp. CFBP 8762]